MAAYSLIQFVSVLILYTINSNLTDIEFLYIDLFMISIFAFFFGKTEAYVGSLVKQTPLNSLISATPIASLVLHLLLVIGFQMLGWFYLQQQSWFTPFEYNNDHEFEHKCYENYTIFIISCFQYIILAVVFSKGTPYRKSIFTNMGFICSLAINTIVSVAIAVWPWERFINWFELEYPPDPTFRITLVAFGFINFTLSMCIEYFIIDNLLFRQLRYRFHNLEKSRRKFLSIENGLRQAPAWPPITQFGNDLNNETSNTPSAIVTNSNASEEDHQSPKSFTEICVESDFVTPLDNCNSVLKGFFDRFDSESEHDDDEEPDSDANDTDDNNVILIKNGIDITAVKPPMAVSENVVIDNSDKETNNRSPSLTISSDTTSSNESNLYLTNNNHVSSSSLELPSYINTTKCTVNNQINEILTTSHS